MKRLAQPLLVLALLTVGCTRTAPGSGMDAVPADETEAPDDPVDADEAEPIGTEEDAPNEIAVPDLPAEAGPDAPGTDEAVAEVVPAHTPASLAAGVDSDALWQDLGVVSAARPHGSTQWKAVQDLCAQRFAALGYTVERHAYASGVNVIGVRAGKTLPAEQVLLSAHYDSVADCAGADDNGTGVAGVLEAARVLAQADFDRTLVVACWDEEEDGLLGSKAYAKRALARGDAIAAALVFEMIGFAVPQHDSQSLPEGFELLFPAQAKWLKDEHQMTGDFVAFVTDEAAHEAGVALSAGAAAAGVPSMAIEVPAALKLASATADLRRSDHAAFWAQGYPAVMITDTSEFRNPHYHCNWFEDSTDTLDPAFLAGVVRATVHATAALAGVR